MINKTKIIIKDNKEIINNNDFINKTKIIFRQEEQTIKRNEILRLNVGTQQVLLNLEEETGKLQLVNKEGNVISEVDLPTERIIKNIYYDDQTQNLVFEFDNYPSINVKLELNDFAKTSDLDDYQRLIDEDNKLDYSLIENAPTIPTNNNQLTNGAGYITNAALTPYAKTDDINRDYQTKITSSNPIHYDLISNVPSFIKKDVNDLENYYTKNQTYNQEEINQLIMAIPTFAIEVVDSLPTSNISTATVYLLTIKDGETPNLYEEWIYIKDVGWELLGTAKVDLKGYATETWVNTQSDLIKKADKNDVDTLRTNLLNLTNRVAANENSIKTLTESLGKKIEATDLLDTNVKLSAHLYTNYNIGRITGASETKSVLIGEKDWTIRKMLENIFVATADVPTTTAPSLSLSLSNNSSSIEYGKVVTISATITANTGRFNSSIYTNGYTTTTGITWSDLNLVSTNNTFSSKTSGITSGTKFTVSTKSTYYAVEDGGTIKGKATAPKGYTWDGKTYAKNNLGNITDVHIASDNNSKESSETQTSIGEGYVPYTYVLATSILTAGSSLPNSLREKNAITNIKINNADGTKKLYIYIPSNKTIKDIKNNNQAAPFTCDSTSLSLVVNNGKSTTFKVYYVNANVAAGSNEFTITYS